MVLPKGKSRRAITFTDALWKRIDLATQDGETTSQALASLLAGRDSTRFQDKLKPTAPEYLALFLTILEAERRQPPKKDAGQRDAYEEHCRALGTAARLTAWARPDLWQAWRRNEAATVDDAPYYSRLRPASWKRHLSRAEQFAYLTKVRELSRESHSFYRGAWTALSIPFVHYEYPVDAPEPDKFWMNLNLQQGPKRRRLARAPKVESGPVRYQP